MTASNRCYTAADLFQTDFPDPVWVVPSLLPEGLGLLCGKPKVGKSFLALNIAVELAEGGEVLGSIPTQPASVLYLALEDNPRRLKSRLQEMLFDTAPPANLLFYTEWRKADQGGLLDLENVLNQRPDIKLVIIDTLERFRPNSNSRKKLYAEDYEAIQGLKKIADARSISILVVHHLRKATSDDPLDMVSGSTGLSGAADTIAVLTRKRGQADAFLYITGRDIEETEFALNFNTDFVRWQILGDGKEFKTSDSRYQILQHLRQTGSPQSPKEIAQALSKNDSTVRVMLSKMLKEGQLTQPAEGKYYIV